MMLFWILVLAAIAVIGALLFELFKSFWKAFFSALGIVSLIAIILGALVFLDAKGLSEKLQASPHLFILEEDGKMLAGMKNPSTQAEDAKMALTKEEAAGYSGLYEKKDYDAILKNNYRLFVFGMKAFESVTDSDFSETKDFDRSLVFDALRSADALDTYINRTMEKADVPEDYRAMLREKMLQESPPESGLRSGLFGILLQASSKKRPLFLFDEYRNGNIRVYPETIFFKALRIMPPSVMKKAEEAMQKGGKKG